ncbi:hypothetical protein NC651_005286 [Populus alba x Populus x berolinensis]|nr:hypothetical protein NC651_005286 [Populus alba x Populus x berolinensis]
MERSTVFYLSLGSVSCGELKPGVNRGRAGEVVYVDGLSLHVRNRRCTNRVKGRKRQSRLGSRFNSDD